MRLVGERAMAELNSRYRGRAASTDVLSFAGEHGPEGWHLGDLVIAVPVLRRQAAAAGMTAGGELRILLLHGVLHCLGYDHERDSGEMERLEARLRRRYCASNSRLERSAG